MHTKRNNLKAFTLIELLIVIVILAIMSTLFIPRLSVITGSQVKSASAQIGLMIKYVYNKSIMTNKIYKINFDIDQNSVFVEYQIISEEKEDAESESESEGAEEDETMNEDLDEDEEEGQMIIGGNKYEVENSDPVLKKYNLPDGVRLSEVYTFHKGKTVDKGTEFAIVSPNGFIEKTYIYLKDSFDRVMTLKVSELTGRVLVYNERVEPE